MLYDEHARVTVVMNRVGSGVGAAELRLLACLDGALGGQKIDAIEGNLAARVPSWSEPGDKVASAKQLKGDNHAGAMGGGRCSPSRADLPCHQVPDSVARSAVLTLAQAALATRHRPRKGAAHCHQ
jgi:hypothetical protein